jgi:hypothetical protein
MTFFLDEGTYRFCDDIVDATGGGNTYIGANALAGALEIRSGRDLAAEPITLVLDGNRMTQAGVADPAKVLSQILGYLHQQRRVDVAFGFSYPDQQLMNLIIPMAAMKINYARLVDQDMNMTEGSEEIIAKLEIVMDSLASRYGRASFRTRSHDDQLEIDATDMFFSFTADAANTERTLFWGKRSPTGTSGSGFGGGSISGGGGSGGGGSGTGGGGSGSGGGGQGGSGSGYGSSNAV